MFYFFIAVVSLAGVIAGLMTSLEYKFLVWIVPTIISTIMYLISTTLKGEGSIVIFALFLYPIILICIIFSLTYYLKLLFVYIQRFDTKKKYIISSVIILILVTTVIRLMPVSKSAVTKVNVSEYPIERLDSVYLANWANSKNDGVYLNKLIQANYTGTQKYLIYSVNKLAEGYRSATVNKQGETLNINITTHGAKDNGHTKYKQAFIIDAGKEPKQINVYLDGKKITPRK